MPELTCECGHAKHDHRTIRYDLKITSTALDSPVEDIEAQTINVITLYKERCTCRSFKAS